ncbi:MULTISPECIES: hypothetical protein [Streptomyces]|uniref:Uncharacterized protein n=1 Tax=Streptomyces griseiscabiei TaxID=2993540 RepID=A0ABU4KYR7_9ACTN|nr:MULTISPECIES: hypothetical protein [Streptomyces]MBZ3904715.1 hypothetical protein [Streptomyces griseiscabiei]MDX2908463.1 hypothetical protein [Streptomyces griseiscabiei]
MDGNDPHIHVETGVVHGDAAARNMLASVFGLAGDLPSLVTTGCGLRVPYSMTSPRADRVTCLVCREHARRELLRLAAQVEHLSRMPGSPISAAQGEEAADRHRDLAREFSDPQD